MLSAVQTEGRHGPGFPGPEKLGHGIPAVRTDSQCLVHGPGELGQGIFFQKPEHTDVLPGAFSPGFRLQPAAKDRETLWQLPSFQGACMIQRPGFPFQKRQVMHRFEAHLLLLPNPTVPGDPVSLVEELHPIHVSLGHNGMMPIADRHRSSR